MGAELQSNVLPANAVKKAMPACLVFALVMFMTFTVDTMIAGHFLGINAVAGIALGTPFILMMLCFTGMIAQGTFLKLLYAMGRNDMEDYHRLFSLSLFFTLFVSCIFLAVCLFLTDGLLSLGGAAKAALEAAILGRIYIRTACLEIFFYAVGSVLMLVLVTFGYRTDNAICSVICMVTNVVLSVVLVRVLPEPIKIAGLGFGTAIATGIQLLVALWMLKRRKIHLKVRFYKLDRKNIIDMLDMLRRGAPSSIDNLMESVSGSVINRLILASFANGTGVLALVAIIKTIYMIVKTIGQGVFFACEPLGGILYAGKDNEGIKKVFTTGIKVGLAYAAGLAALLIIFKTPILSFYNIAADPAAHTGLIVIALSGMILVFVFTLNVIYETSGHLLLALIVAVIPDSILFPLLIPVASRSMGINGIWLAMGFNFIPFFVVYYLILVIFNRKFPLPLDRLLFLEDMKNSITELDVSVPVDAKDVTFISDQIQKFLLNNGSSKKKAYKAALCTEEIAADYIEHRKKEKKQFKNAFMDIKVFREDDDIKIILRNFDEPYNPLVFEQEKDSFKKIGVSMVQKISREISHSYAYHLNIITIVM